MIKESELGTDIDRNWIIDNRGNLQLVTGSENLTQAIRNRLTCYFNNLSWCYPGYGSYVRDWIGEPNDPYRHDTLLKEVTKRVSEDIRLREVSVSIVDYSYWGVGLKVKAIVVEDGSKFEEYFLFTNQEEPEIDVWNGTFHDTHIITRGRGYYTIHNHTVTVHAHILDEEDRFVPIGEVSIWLGEQYIETLEIEQSGTNEPGTVTFKVHTPLHLHYGKHVMTIKYHGKQGYNPCTYNCNLIVLEKLPTSTMFDDDMGKYYINEVDRSHEGIPVAVDDVNYEGVTIGVVEAYAEDDIPETVTIEHPIIYETAELYEEDVTIIALRNLINYTKRYIFVMNHRFYGGAVFKLISDNNVLIDTLKVYYDNNRFYLVHTSEDIKTDNVLKVYA
ncbi:hypothetical protein [Methanosphaera sp.]|uniref:hypothetical protein n=1 Tax=Methanosphaera sp. TaxID=2666342 RepID=UPI0025F7BAEC|nr:hypothetical protein [Methanosphaera sp.]